MKNIDQVFQGDVAEKDTMGQSFSGGSCGDRDELGLTRGYGQGLLGHWKVAQSGARWPQRMKWLWRVLNREVT